MGFLSKLKAKVNQRKSNTDNPTSSSSKAKPESGSASQPLPHDASQGLADELLASVPPPAPSNTQQQVQDAQRAGEQEQAKGEALGGEQAVKKQVQVEAPVPTLAANTSAPVTASDSTAPPKGAMASDEDYMSFLDKANEDPSKGTAKSQGGGKVELKAVDAEVPKVLNEIVNSGDKFYISDADEPFEAVALKYGGKGLPDEAGFAKLVNHPDPKKAEVEIMDVAEWDPQGQYKDVVEATREASKGSDVRVYKISREGARVEYWVVGLEGGKLVGVKALAIES